MFSNDKGYVVLYKHVILNVKLLVVHQIFKYLKEAPTLDCFLFNFSWQTQGDCTKSVLPRVYHTCWCDMLWSGRAVTMTGVTNMRCVTIRGQWLRYNALSWSSGKPFAKDAAPIPFKTILSSSDPGVTSSLLFKSGGGFREWLSCGNRGGTFPPLDTDSVSEISDERSLSNVEDADEPSGNKANNRQ